MLTGSCGLFGSGSEIADLSRFCEDVVNEPPGVEADLEPFLWATCMQENGARCSETDGELSCTLEPEDGTDAATIESPF